MALSRGPFRLAALLLSTILPLAIEGCAGVESYRSLTGVNRNDPDPQTALFTGNLAEAEKSPYPNLASVPPPPTGVTTAAERQKLAAALLADRAGAEAAAKLPPGLAPPNAAAATAKTTDKGTSKTAAAALNAPAPVPVSPPAATAGAVAPPRPAAAPAPSPMAAASAPPAASAAAVNTRPPNTTGINATGANPLPPVDAVQPGNPPGMSPLGGQAKAKGGLPGDKTASNNSQNFHRRADEPPEPGPRDSTMQMPEVRSTPQPEASRAAPAPAALGRVAMPAPIAQPNPAIDTAAVPAPAPAVPELPPVPPPPAAVAPQSRTPPPPSTVATLAMPSGPGLDSNGRQQVEHVAALFKEKPGNVRVVARTPPPTAGTDPLSSYHAALGRAQAVADALKAAGVPANKIQTEATPNVGAGAGRIDIQLAP